MQLTVAKLKAFNALKLSATSKEPVGMKLKKKGLAASSVLLSMALLVSGC